VRLTPTRPSRRAGRTFRPGEVFLVLAAVLASTPSPSSAQATKAKAVKPPPDTRPLARYVPHENPILYAGTDGLDAHADAWKKTAAYKMLNDTPLGEMLETMGTQLADKALAFRPQSKVSGAEVVAMIKHVARSGFVASLNMWAKDEAGRPGGSVTVVVRGAAGRFVRPMFSRAMGGLMASSKPQVVKKGGRNVVEVTPAANAKGKSPAWSWWAEGDDLVIAPGPGSAEAIMAVLDGKRPSAVNNPARAELTNTEGGGFRPVFVLMVDPTGVLPNSAAAGFFKSLDNATGINRFDYRWGFHDDALVTVARIKAPRPRRRLAAVFDQPSFEKGKLPPLPDGIEAFTVLSVEPVKLLDAVLAMAQTPEARARITEHLDALKTKSRLDVRKDLLAHLGPRMAVYVVPGTTPTRTAADGAPAEKDAAAGPLAGLLGGLPGVGAGVQIPRYAVVAEIDNAEAVGKALDNLMVAVNRQLKEQAALAADAAAPPPADGSPRPATPKARPGRRLNGPAPEFKLMPGKDKVYTLNSPAGSPWRLPPGFRPTVRLGAKHLAISVTPDAARLALETKPGEWTPPADLVAAFEQLPRSLMVLNVSDPRQTLPELLAALPANLQRGVNTVVALNQAKPPVADAAGATGNPAAAGMPGPPGSSGMPGGPPNSGSGASSSGGRSSSSGGGSSSGSDSTASSAMSPAAMQMKMMQNQSSGGQGSGSSQPGAAGAGGEADGASAMLQFKIDPEKLPKADDLRAKMFPSSFAVSSDDQEVRIISRVAFPGIASPGGAGVAAGILMPAVQAARAAAMRAAGGRALPGMPTTPAAPAAGASPAATAPAAAPPGGPARRGSGSSGGPRSR